MGFMKASIVLTKHRLFLDRVKMQDDKMQRKWYHLNECVHVLQIKQLFDLVLLYFG